MTAVPRMGISLVAEAAAVRAGVASVSYTHLITGQQAVEILTGAKSVSETAIGFDTTLEKKYNAANCEALGITVPEDRCV